MTDEFTCAICRQTYRKGVTDEEAEKECEELFGIENASQISCCVLICDDCFHRVDPRKVKVTL